MPISIVWLFNGEKITNEQAITTSQVGKRANALNIDNVQGINAGNFTCEAKNIAGIVQYTAELIVNGSFTMFEK